MSDRLPRRIVLVTRTTRLEELLVRHTTAAQARFYVEHLGADFGEYELEHARYAAALRAAEEALSKHGRVQRLERSFLPNFLFPPDAPIVVLGQDGLVANTLKYAGGQAVVGVNPDPQRWNGVLLPFTVADLERLMPEVIAARRPTRRVSMAVARLTDGQELHAVNDIFIGARSHVSARYRLALGDAFERQSSSGIIVSTGLGSTGWLRSILTGAVGIAGAEARPLAQLRERGFAWDAPYLYYSVREPFPSVSTRAGMVFGQVTHEQPLRVVSEMGGDGVIFSDGLQADALEFNGGMEATIAVAERSGLLAA